MTVSKSDYLLFLKHPAWLWLKKHDKTKLPPVDENTQAIFNAGHLFEGYAETLFPEAIQLGFSAFQEYELLTEATHQAIHGGAKTLFQARFEHESLTCISDVVDFVDANTVDLYEIKSSTKVKPEHIDDLAFQLIVLERCGYTVRNIAVVHVNNQYVKQGDIQPKELVATTDVTQTVKDHRSATEESMTDAIVMLKQESHPDFSPLLASKAGFSEWLSVYNHLFPQESGSIYDLCGINADLLRTLQDQGITNLVDIPENTKLRPAQAMQLESSRLGQPITHKDKINVFLSELTFPLYFLDYETLSSVVPYFDGLKPYSQLPFQYSLHVIDEPGAEPHHIEYLHRNDSSPAQPLSESLRAAIGDVGSVITWNMSFEKTCNTFLGSLLPEYQTFFSDINDRVVDLMLPFSKYWYVDGRFMGSASIKYVLPVLAPHLSYKVLGIQEGATAQRIWMEAALNSMHEQEKEKIFNDLVEYCKLDTFAMVKIYEKLREI